MKPNFFIFLFLLSGFAFDATLHAQHPERVSGQILVWLEPEIAPEALVRKAQTEVPFSSILHTCTKVSETLNIWLLNMTPDDSQEHRMLEWLRRQPGVRGAQFNRVLEQRGQSTNITPDDPQYAQQWHHFNNGSAGGIWGADMSSELAWNITTGGVTPHGDTIVVAVIDGGIEAQHEDLAENIWYNRHEIPNDGVDNDGNGYVDDFRGWNVFGNNDNIAGIATGHGTPVSALVGAKGNNNIGVAGVNWDVKILFVAGNSQEAVILAAYDYVLRARKRYNATNGQQGAFIVAVNCSWGITGGQPANFPLWCAVFDSLGAAGILSVAATANSPVNVDVVGDMPTACGSDYLITVTNLTQADQKADNAAWGATSIDLGAYGRDVYTARAGNTYGTVSGTSFAAPQVSGAIGLLYAAPCNNLVAMAKADPGAAALWTKSQLLGSTAPVSALQNITVTGGRLNLYNLLQGYEDQCADCVSPFGFRAEAVSENALNVHWSVVSGVSSVNVRWRKKGDPLWNLVPGASSPLVLNGLQICSEYEFSLRANCTDSTSSHWTTPTTVRTEGCCSPPTAISASSISATSAQIIWYGPGAATGYRVRFRSATGSWQETQVAQNNLTLNELYPCTAYQVEVSALCASDTVSVSTAFSFTTAGCGACTDLTYCSASASSAKDEWIANVEIGNWSHASGGTVGYQNFTGVSGDVPQLLPMTSTPITLTPGFSSLPYKEHFRVFIDYNADGDFDDADELAFDPGFTSDMAISGLITPPAGIASGLTRMRVVMKYRGLIGTPPLPCETFEFGQVVDYCVHLGPLVSTNNSQTPMREVALFPQPANQTVSLRFPAEVTGPAEVVVLDAHGRTVLRRPLQSTFDVLTLDVSSLAQGAYLLTARTASALFSQKMLVIRP